MNATIAKLEERMRAADTLLCVGLDPELDALPARFRALADPLFAFNRHVIEATAPFAAAFKPNTAFYEAHGAHGIAQLQQTCDFLRAQHPETVLVLDAKRGDTANTNAAYARFAFDVMGADAVTLHNYLGAEACAPFLDRSDRACIFLCRTSNPGAADVQDLVVRIQADGGERSQQSQKQPLWQTIAAKVTREWDRGGNTMLVVGATYPAEMRALRALAPATTFLVPGVGAQGGDVAKVVQAGLDARGLGLLISASRSILGAASPGDAARALRDEINRAREEHTQHARAADIEAAHAAR